MLLSGPRISQFGHGHVGVGPEDYSCWHRVLDLNPELVIGTKNPGNHGGPDTQFDLDE
jgi:hypothetical protein